MEISLFVYLLLCHSPRWWSKKRGDEQGKNIETITITNQTWWNDNRPFAQSLAWVRDGASGDGRSVTCTWIAPRTARNGDKKSTSRPSETLKLHVGDWPTNTGCPVSNPGNNCANGLLHVWLIRILHVLLYSLMHWNGSYAIMSSSRSPRS